MNSYKQINAGVRFVIVLIVLFMCSFFLMCVVGAVGVKGDFNKLDFFGYRPFIIVSGSMEPYMPTNSVVVTKSTPFENISVGDVIVFDTAEYGLVMHRVVDVREQGYITKGDNNSDKDNWVVTKDMYITRVNSVHDSFVPFLTFLFGDMTKLSFGSLLWRLVFLSLCVSACIFILNFLYDYFLVYYCLKKDKKTSSLNNTHFEWMCKRVTPHDIEVLMVEMDKKRNIIGYILFRYRVMRLYTGLIEEEKQIRKVKKRFDKLKRGYL